MQSRLFAARTIIACAKLVAVFIILFLCTVVLQAQAGQGRPLITGRIDDGVRISLPGSVPPQAQSQYDQGPVPDSAPANHILMVLKRSASQQASLEERIAQQHEQTSPLYHQWLTPNQFAAQYGLADEDLQAVQGWLQSQGFTINKTSRGRQVVDFSGNAAQVRSAFHTELHTYVRNGITFHSNNSNPQIPAALAPAVSGVVSLNDIKPQSYLKVLGSVNMDPKKHTAQPNWNAAVPCYNSLGQLSTCTYYLPTPGDLAVQYGLAASHKSGLTGKGVTIGIVDDSNIDLGVVRNYRKLFGLNPANLPGIILDGNDPAQNGDATEAYLDVEAASATAPDATVDLYISADTITTSGLANAIVRVVDDDIADILSVSYGECEQQLGPSGNEFIYQFWQQAAAQGQSVFVAAGDSGSAGCDNDNFEGQATEGLAVSGFASTPYNTAVGATDFYYSQWAEGPNGPDLIAELNADWSGSTTTFGPTTTLAAPLNEQPWNNSFGLDIFNFEEGYTIVAGGGGASSCELGGNVDPNTGAWGTCTAGYPKPSWQTGLGVPSDGVRDIPDVALFGASGINLSFWPICAGVYDCLASSASPGYSMPVTGVGGTSASAPAMAGIIALVDQAQHGRQGNVNSRLYALAAQYPATFNEVTLGSNNVPCVDGSPNCSLDTNGDGFYSLQNYTAGPGYNLASGLGSVNGGLLLANWNKVLTNVPATSTTLSLSQTVFQHGTPITATATVSAHGREPSGLVAVEASVPTQVGQGVITISNGTGTASIDGLPGGTYKVQGSYNNAGTGNFGPSSSRPITVTVQPEASVASLAGTQQNYLTFQESAITNGETLPYGTEYFLDTTISGVSGHGTPTGYVTYFDGAAKLGTASVSESSVAELALGKLVPGNHHISAKYSGDASFEPSNTAPLALTVVQGTPYVFYTGTSGSYGPPVLTGQIYTAPVIVTSDLAYSAAPTGTVTIAIGSLPPQTVKLTRSYNGGESGMAVAFFTPTTPGTYPVSVTYSGDANYLPAQSLTYPVSITVTAPTLPATVTNLTTSTYTVGPDGTVLLSASVKGSIKNTVPTGSVAFNLSIGLGYYVNLDASGHASVLIGGEGFPTGATTVFASYSGDTNYSSSVSKPVIIHSNQGDFSIVAAKAGLTLTSGSSTDDEIILQSVVSNYVESGLRGDMSLSCTTSSPKIACSITPGSIWLAASGKPSRVQATITARDCESGNYTVTIHGNLLGVQHSLVLEVLVR